MFDEHGSYPRRGSNATWITLKEILYRDVDGTIYLYDVESNWKTVLASNYSLASILFSFPHSLFFVMLISIYKLFVDPMLFIHCIMVQIGCLSITDLWSWSWCCLISCYKNLCKHCNPILGSTALGYFSFFVHCLDGHSVDTMTFRSWRFSWWPVHWAKSAVQFFLLYVKWYLTGHFLDITDAISSWTIFSIGKQEVHFTGSWHLVPKFVLFYSQIQNLRHCSITDYPFEWVFNYFIDLWRRLTSICILGTERKPIGK